MRFRRLGYTALGLVLLAGSAQATGFSRGTADTDILFEPGGFNFRAGASFAMPSQKFRSNPGGSTTGGVVGTNYLDTYVIPSAAVKFSITDNLACAGTYTDAYGAASSFDEPYGPAGTLSEEFTVAEFGATCAIFFDVGQGRFSILGGGFVERFDYSLASMPMLFGGLPFAVGLDSTAYGWRAGVAYEIPDIALRAQLLYRSGTTHDAEGLAATPFGVFPAIGSGRLPQSVELKVQSGIAPGWLAFGSVKWTDWSVNEELVVQIPVGGMTSSNQYFWRDGWTVNAGVAHAFTENVSGLASLQWDRGVSTGYDLRSDRWRLVAGASMRDAIGGELRLGGGVSYLTSATVTEGFNTGASVRSGWAGILSASYSVRW